MAWSAGSRRSPALPVPGSPSPARRLAPRLRSWRLTSSIRRTSLSSSGRWRGGGRTPEVGRRHPVGASALVGRTFGRSRSRETRRDPAGVAANPVLLGLASDGRLAAHVREGSDRAFEVLFERHHRALLAFCRSMVGSTDEADDALQQTFLAAYRDLARGREPDALRPWLLRHRAAALPRDPQHPARSPRRRGARARDGRSPQTTSRPGRTCAGFSATSRACRRASARALVLAELGGLPHDEIAAILGCRREKVKALVFQARTSLTTGRAARDASCAEVRAELARTVHAAVARRKVLRRHLRDCTDCQAFARPDARRAPGARPAAAGARSQAPAARRAARLGRSRSRQPVASPRPRSW